MTKKQFKKVAFVLDIIEQLDMAKQASKFWTGYDERLETFKFGLMLKQARLESGLTQEQIAKRLKTTKSVVSRMENHATDIRLFNAQRSSQQAARVSTDPKECE